MANKLPEAFDVPDLALTAALIEEAVDVPVFTPAEPAPVNLLGAFSDAGIGWVPCAPFPCSFVFYRMDDESEGSHLHTLRSLLPDFDTMKQANGCASEYFADGGEYLILIGWRLNSHADGNPLPLIDRISILLHEIHHAINFVMAHVHQRYDLENDEFTAYLHDYHLKAALVAVGFGEASEWRTNTGI